MLLRRNRFFLVAGFEVERDERGTVRIGFYLA
jgi:hypothetical protein